MDIKKKVSSPLEIYKRQQDLLDKDIQGELSELRNHLDDALSSYNEKVPFTYQPHPRYSPRTLFVIKRELEEVGWIVCSYTQIVQDFHVKVWSITISEKLQKEINSYRSDRTDFYRITYKGELSFRMINVYEQLFYLEIK